MPRRHRKDCTSDSELADSNDDPFERQSGADFNYTTPESGSENDERSPSQYRKQMTEELADESIDEQQEMEEEEECAKGEVFDGDAYDKMVLSNSSGSEQMFAHFLNVTRKFTETLEDVRKQDLMESRSKNSHKSLDVDALQPPSRGRPQKFTPPRKASQFISASQEECGLEAESMTPQSSRTARTHLMETFREIRTKSKTDNTPEQINN